MIFLPKLSVQLVADIPRQAREWRNNAAINKWCRQFTLIDEMGQAEWEVRTRKDESIKMYGVQNRENIDVGVCGLTSIDRVNQKAEFSLYIAPAYQGAGYGKDALVTLLHHGFYAHNLNRVWGEVFADNPAMKMFEAVGLKLEGIQRQSYFRDGKFIDSLIVSVLRSEFKWA